jgi:hypothetical protein
MKNRFNNIKNILKTSEKTQTRKGALGDLLKTSEKTQTRKAALGDLLKTAAGDQHGIFQHFQSNVAEYATRDRYLAMRGGESSGRDTASLYGLSPDHEDSYVPTEYVAPHLSTRYSPDRVGVQAQRVSDGVFQDPYTNKVYDYNEGFNTEDGRTFPAGNAALQSSMMHLANHLEAIGLKKEAHFLDVVVERDKKGKGNTRFERLEGLLSGLRPETAGTGDTG